MRIAIINKQKCNPISCGNFLCMRVCPVNRTGKECITQERDKPAIDEMLCNGCGICQNRCPFQAIQIINLPEKLKEEPVQRFGKNNFELFRLPIPKEKTVVGLLGRNGIGKSTALEILSGNLIPNLGDYSEEGNKEKVIKHFSKTAMHEYFKKLYNGKLKVSYKPQRIELLPKLYKGKVKDLLEKIDERKQSNKLVKELQLDHLMDRHLSKLSGGEMQKVAIIAAMVKKADFYFFDEPASFLDVTSRIKVAKLIRELSKDSAVMVVEHDLATLDYISDEIQILYGKQAGYGVVSQSKGVRRGINEYLDGFLPDDNVRFRDYGIVFAKAPEGKTTEPAILFEFPELEKKFKGFELKTNKGNVHKAEVMAVMGANGLGKTTFLKLLAGLEKPTTGKIDKIKISYKEQYPEIVKGTVREWLEKSKDYKTGWYKQNILEKLGLLKVIDSEISSLSGGELQKVYIAVCLGNEAELYALDEPSAFIDVEDRLKVAEVIKEFILKKEKAAIVVDHDVQFTEYIADSMLVFEGVPSVNGEVYGPCTKREGMNRVLKMLDITYRKDKDTNRPRINKGDSQLDKEQRSKGEYYYS
ncbi:MAG: ribosome biogenesis/translation initiation ATPase RLI [Nanoarchaeota archaeon]|nr:ribosome biogenesis/translation initiation ATPase RLI [Nanoarchaeota archaeon]MBU1444756.1 ribosome biogenesis/translation initiation ATPase RLI [Nanoarchaeota archaeon]MBU2420119.1 ribosome biogenesis/translation initiation ATPase RLI [Nanoarchaeota archaeon]MBU2474885.1 ribosome biogenesis/translation initiation ATPase RLI [Nanoarchaeota archaeon]MBU3941083.1 ribosome biogenesis/translation initiation ATPase RLI [Nanoarchaeota archaeon]